QMRAPVGRSLEAGQEDRVVREVANVRLDGGGGVRDQRVEPRRLQGIEETPATVGRLHRRGGDLTCGMHLRAFSSPRSGPGYRPELRDCEPLLPPSSRSTMAGTRGRRWSSLHKPHATLEVTGC